MIINKGVTYLKRKILNSISPDLKFRLKIPDPITNEDRKFLENNIFFYINSIAQKGDNLLFMGVGPYTWHYYRQLKYKVYTIDFDTERAKYGKNGNHTIGSVTQLNEFYEKNFFKVIVANGLIGYGLNSKNEFEDMIRMCHECLTENGILILGYNNTPSHLTFVLEDTQLYTFFDEYVPGIPQMSSPSIEVNSDNNHTFLFLRKKHRGS